MGLDPVFYQTSPVFSIHFHSSAHTFDKQFSKADEFKRDKILSRDEEIKLLKACVKDVVSDNRKQVVDIATR